MAVPWCIDLDGTLVRTDALLESLLVLLKGNPCYLFLSPFWLLKGKAYTKQQIARRVTLDVTSLPYHAAFLDYLIAERRSGRTLVLVTAADQRIPQQIARYPGIIDEVLASDGKTNLSGRRKLQVLQKRFGEKRFVYTGVAPIDMTIWEHAREAIAVSSSAKLVVRHRDYDG